MEIRLRPDDEIDSLAILIVQRLTGRHPVFLANDVNLEFLVAQSGKVVLTRFSDLPESEKVRLEDQFRASHGLVPGPDTQIITGQTTQLVKGMLEKEFGVEMSRFHGETLELSAVARYIADQRGNFSSMAQHRTTV